MEKMEKWDIDCNSFFLVWYTWETWQTHVADLNYVSNMNLKALINEKIKKREGQLFWGLVGVSCRVYKMV